jgi:hypothetical protein
MKQSQSKIASTTSDTKKPTTITVDTTNFQCTREHKIQDLVSFGWSSEIDEGKQFYQAKCMKCKKPFAKTKAYLQEKLKFCPLSSKYPAHVCEDWSSGCKYIVCNTCKSIDDLSSDKGRSTRGRRSN